MPTNNNFYQVIALNRDTVLNKKEKDSRRKKTKKNGGRTCNFAYMPHNKIIDLSFGSQMLLKDLMYFPTRHTKSTAVYIFLLALHSLINFTI